MLLNHLLGLPEDEVFLAEESMEDLLGLPVTRQIIEAGIEADACIEIEGLGVAIHLSRPEEVWLMLTDRYSGTRILESLSREWREKGSRRVHLDERDLLLALIEYFSVSMADGLLCDACPAGTSPTYIRDRIDRLKAFLGPMIPRERSILEICCGSGMATQALLELGHRPLSMDRDRCDLCQAIRCGLMDPRRCFVLDARLLPAFFSPRSFDAVLGFMVGLIDEFNWPTWREIILKASSLARETMILTVYTKKEAERIAKALLDAGWRGEVIDNRDQKGIYDQWAYWGERLG